MTRKNAPLKIAVLGAGLIGERHARLIDSLPEFVLGAIIDPSIASARLANDLGAKHFAELTDFFEGDIVCDGVVIATPNETHKAFALACFEKGLPCLIEKPLAANSVDASGIEQAAEKFGVGVLVGHHRRHHEVSRNLKERIEAHEFGKLVGAQLTWMLKKPDDYYQAGEWRTQKGGGPVWINLIHEIDLLRYFMGEIVEVSAFVSNNTRGFEVEDTGVINMRCENGALISAMVSDTAPSPWHFEGGSGENPNISRTGHDGLRVYGDKAAVEFPSMTKWQHEASDGHWGEPIHSTKNATQNTLGGETALTAQLHNFAGVISKETLPLVSAKDGVQSVRVVEAIHESATTGTTVKISIN